jgi:hypothetical protein
MSFVASPPSPPRPRWVTATVCGLVVMITWTLAVKYLVPLLYVASRALEGSDEPGRVMWDFWPLAHAAFAVLLWRGARYAWEAGVLLAAAESAVVIAKFARFLAAPEWSFWKLLWFTNKIYVLAFFLCLLAVLLGPGRRSFDAARRAKWGGAAA